ncbi:MAG: dihydrofolate reductase [Candidatus Doudnabacteria bacterium]|nr:dihydrofolate reductase [Candidatus Doudnabacteria bacterium]
MRKLFVFNMVTLDGFFEGPGQDINWHMVDEEFNKFAVEQLAEIGTLLFGRRTFELMAQYWPTELALKDDAEVAQAMNSLEKVTVSTSLTETNWNNSRIVKGNLKEEVVKLKEQPGKDVAIFGSSDLISTLIPMGVIDEYRLMVCPLVLGAGKQMFHDLKQPLKLNLEKTRTFGNGNILLTYRPQT